MAFVYQKPTDTCGDGNGSSVQSSHGAYWQSFPVLYSIDVIGEYNFAKDSQETVFNAVMNCFAYVNDLVKFEFFKYTEDEDKAKLKVSFGPLGDSTLGRCSTNRTSKRINRGTIIMDSSSRKWRVSPNQHCSSYGTYYDIQNTLTHEIGHAIGLAHNFGDKKATMYNKAGRGTTYRRTFSKGERELINRIYGKFAA